MVGSETARELATFDEPEEAEQAEEPAPPSALEVWCIVADTKRCIQCGTCAHDCPLGIDVRAFAWRGRPIVNRGCYSCGQCIERCEHHALHFERCPDGRCPTAGSGFTPPPPSSDIRLR